MMAESDGIRNSLIIPVYRNEANIPALLEALQGLNEQVLGLEVVFVVDGSPDRSAELLDQGVAKLGLEAQLVLLSRNFGAFAAIRQGLSVARGANFGVMAADLQEPPSLIVQFFKALTKDECDVAVGVREERADPFITKMTSQLYWMLYRHLVIKEIPPGGVDIFACNRKFRDALLQLEERTSFLIGQLFWLGFRRLEIPYDRQARTLGQSAWSLRKRIRYMADSLIYFSDLPINFLFWIGGLGVALSAMASVFVIGSWLVGGIGIKGYVPIMLAISFFGSTIILCQGIIGFYVWRVFDNTKKRPISVTLASKTFTKVDKANS